jgi:multidrug resistance efflux pump
MKNKTPTSPDAPPPAGRLKALLVKLMPLVLTLGVAAIALVAGRRVWQHYAEAPWTRDAHVRADVLQIAPDVSGLLTEVQVHDNQRVARGAVLFQVDRARYELALAQARAALAGQSAMLAQARREAQRNHRLSDLVSAENIEEGDIKVRQGEAALAAAQAAVQVAELNLGRTLVRSPVDGYLNDRAPHAGDYVSAGRPVLSMVDGGAVYVDAYFEETKLDQVHPGQAVNIQIMGQQRTLRGHVQSVAAGIEDRDRSSGSNLLPNVNPAFNWVRLAQRIPVRIAIDEWPADQRPVIGRTATVSVLGDSAAATPAAASAPASSAASGTRS